MPTPRATERTEGLREIFRQGFRRQASSVAVVTYVDGDGDPFGMTATSVSSLSASPPSVIVCVNREAQTHETVLGQGRFGINFLAETQEDISTFCSTPGADKRLESSWVVEAVEERTPVLADALCHFDCDLVEAHHAFTHSILVGRVIDVWVNPHTRSPLLYFKGAYYQLGASKHRMPGPELERYMGWGV